MEVAGLAAKEVAGLAEKGGLGGRLLGNDMRGLCLWTGSLGIQQRIVIR